jgi:hypothetical protein
MKRNVSKKTESPKSRKDFSNALQSPRKVRNKKSIDIKLLDQELLEESFESITNEMEFETSNNINWNETQDRGDDLVNIRDPLVQWPERASEIPPELPQKKLNETPGINEELS